MPAAGVVSPFDKLEDGQASFDLGGERPPIERRGKTLAGRCRTRSRAHRGPDFGLATTEAEGERVYWLEMRPSVGYMRVRRRDGCWRASVLPL